MSNPSTPLPEQGGFNERLDEVAAEYYHRWVKYGYYGNPEKLDQDTEFNQFKAAIRTLVLEELEDKTEWLLEDMGKDTFKHVEAVPLSVIKELGDTHGTK